MIVQRDFKSQTTSRTLTSPEGKQVTLALQIL
jgi:hypothetical protein